MRRSLSLATVCAAAGCTEINLASDRPTLPPDDRGFLFPGSYSQAVWSPSSSTIYAASGSSLIALDVASRTARTLGSMASAAEMAITPDEGTLIHSALEGNPAKWSIYRTSVASGGPSILVTAAANSEFLLSPDGSTVAYHPAGVTEATTTIQLIDLASGARSEIVPQLGRPGAFSPDGKELAFLPPFSAGPPSSQPVILWNSITGFKEKVSMPGWEPLDLAWHNGFRALVRNVPYNTTKIVDRPVKGTDSTLFEGNGFNAFHWLPEVQSVVLVVGDGKTYLDGRAEIRHYLIKYHSPAGMTMVGSINSHSTSPLRLSVSPDRRWLIHFGFSSTIYLLPLP